MEVRGVKGGNRQPQRVLMLSWEYPPRIVGGIARHVAELSRALAEQGMQVEVVTAHHPGAAVEEEIPISRGAGSLRILRAAAQPINALDFVSEIHQLDFGLLERTLRDWNKGTAGALAQQYDVIHAHDWLVAFAARTLRHGLQIPLVATIHATEAGRQNGLHTPMQHYIHSIEWLLTYDAWRVICCSQAMMGEVQLGLRVPSDKLRVIPNGVDPERMQCHDSPEKLKAFRQRWAQEEERIILFVGRLVREKGAEVLIEAMPEVLRAHPEAKLVVAGGGWAGHLTGRAAALGIGHKVTFAGFVPEEDLPRLYAVAEVAVFPSLYEPFGIVAIEAMAAGKAVVTSDIGGFREVVKHEETGLQTWANNAGSLAWGIKRVLGDPALAAKLRRSGRKEAIERFGWAGIAKDTISVYQEVMALAEAGHRPALPEAGPGIRPRYLVMSETARRS